MFYQENFDVIVIGGGHAGTEAALAKRSPSTSSSRWAKHGKWWSKQERGD